MHQLKMNPLKCAFGVTLGRFLGFVVRNERDWNWSRQSQRYNPNVPSKKLKRIEGFTREFGLHKALHLKFVRKVPPFHKTPKKGYIFHSGSSLSKCFWKHQAIPHKATSPNGLNKGKTLNLIIEKPLILYTVALERSLGAMLAQCNEEEKENAL